MASISTLEQLETITADCPSGARVFAYCRRSHPGLSNTLPALVLLHGYPQNSLMYKHFVSEIPETWPLLVPDLPGYVSK